VAAAPTLKEALRRYRAQPHDLDWLSVACDIVAMDMWDDEAWFELAASQLRLARANGTLSWLPFTLDYLAENHVQAGELSKAAALRTEREGVDPGTREATLPYVPLLLAAWRGDGPGLAGLAGEMTRGASDRGEGAALTYTDYAQAVLHNGLGNYGAAADAAHRASAVDEMVLSPWALYELTEAAARSDQHERACAAADQLARLAVASGSNWARGAAARSRALVSGGRAAEAAPIWSTANGCAGASGGSRPVISCGPRSTRSRPWAPRPSPSAPGESSWPPARRCASAPTTPAPT